ncbi:MAG TPA: M23 family metallopeptidase [Candidatus Rikenella faecigallinarum]|uniref:M23 family metallopeptidase n=1 Tax=Candidatus Rikenella faecigallinarum TaxID=2838745 RepID=A0A9D1TXW7_9BACT|nr:M23 family metallopeptidase [Candidatus Rikenella faecigallinarum]
MNREARHNTPRRPSVRRYPRLMKWTIRFFSGVAVAVVYFIVFSIFFDTPIEYELKKSTRRIENEYEVLLQRYDTLQQVLANVSERDRSVYNILFESDPQMQEDQDRQRRLDFRKRLEGMSNLELGNWFDEHLGLLYQQVTNYVAMTEQQQARVAADVRKALSIPAIQPVDNHQLTLLTASFGERVHPFFKTMTQHTGVDYSVPTGTAVFATADGEVRSLKARSQTSGLSIVIDHGNGYETVYSHLDKVVAQPGRHVNRGDIIAFSGNSGLSFAPHLHYEVRYKGKPVDPLNYFFVELDMPSMRKLREISRMGMQSFD